MSAASDILKLIKEKEIEFVDLRFTDPRGKLQHMTQDLTTIDEDFLNDGTFFDGSSIAGWKAINESDMILKPDLSRTFVDPFTSHNTLVIFCDIMDPIKNDYYERDPRSIAKKAEAYLKTTGIGDTIYFGPEPEFFIFDDVKISNTMQKVSFQVDSNEGPYNGDKEYPSASS
jgi:glutamine synthetase